MKATYWSVALGLAAALIALPTSASARATSTWFESTETGSEPIVDECHGPGLIEGSSTIVGHEVHTFGPDGQETGSHVQITVTDTIHLTFENGSYGDGTAHTRFLLNTSAGSGADTFTQPHVDKVLIYSPDGQSLDRIIFHEIVHVTVVGDTIKANISRGHFSLFCEPDSTV